jgi:sugar lactone lactonase YvrE
MNRVQDPANIRCVLRADAKVGESPIWSESESCLYWVDIQGKKIHRFFPKEETNDTFEMPEIVTSLALHKSGGLILTLEKDIATYDPRTGKIERLAHIEGDQPENRFNDGKCDPQGRFWVGTMGAKNWKSDSGSLYRFGTDHSVTCMQTSVKCSNGSGWSPDGRTFYYTESFRYQIFAYDFTPESGEIRNRRIFASFPENPEIFPDGLTVDSEGFVWSNLVGIGQIHRFDPKGKCERIIQLPVPRATSCTFGGADLKTLYVTSATETMSAAQLREAPLSGSLFAMDFEVKGILANSFAG